MNGVQYECDGCGRLGRADERCSSYECPVCRWVGPLGEGRHPIRMAAWRRLRRKRAPA